MDKKLSPCRVFGLSISISLYTLASWPAHAAPSFSSPKFLNGLKPLVNESATEIPYVSRTEPGARSRLGTLASGDFLPLSDSRVGAVENIPLVFCGYGLRLSKGKHVVYDDFQSVDLRGAMALIMDGMPEAKEGSIFSSVTSPWTRAQKAEQALKRGAIGVVFLVKPNEGEGILPLSETQNSDNAGLGKGYFFLAKLGAVEADAPGVIGATERIEKNQRPASFRVKTRWALNIDLRRELGYARAQGAILEGMNTTYKQDLILLVAKNEDGGEGVSALEGILNRLNAEKRRERSYAFVLVPDAQMGFAAIKSVYEKVKAEKKYRPVMGLYFDGVADGKQLLRVEAGDSAYEFPIWLANAAKKKGTSFQNVDLGPEASVPRALLGSGVPTLFFRFPKVGSTQFNEGLDLVSELLLRSDRLASAATPNAKLGGAQASMDAKPKAYLGAIFEVQDQGQAPLLKTSRTGSPAEKAGLKDQDLIQSLAGIVVHTQSDLDFALNSIRPKDRVSITWLRAGQLMEAEVELTESEAR